MKYYVVMYVELTPLITSKTLNWFSGAQCRWNRSLPYMWYPLYNGQCGDGQPVAPPFREQWTETTRSQVTYLNHGGSTLKWFIIQMHGCSRARMVQIQTSVFNMDGYERGVLWCKWIKINSKLSMFNTTDMRCPFTISSPCLCGQGVRRWLSAYCQ